MALGALAPRAKAALAAQLAAAASLQTNNMQIRPSLWRREAQEPPLPDVFSQFCSSEAASASGRAQHLGPPPPAGTAPPGGCTPVFHRSLTAAVHHQSKHILCLKRFKPWILFMLIISCTHPSA